MSSYVVDTVALARYLQDDLPARASSIFREAERGRHRLLVPQIVLAEFIYIVLRGRVKGSAAMSSLREVIHNLLSSPIFSVSGMPDGAWEVLQGLRIQELHDRMIAAEAISRKLPILTNDGTLKSVEGLQTIW